MNERDAFELFWENSKLNPYTIRSFAKKLDEDIKQFHTTSHLYYPTEDLMLPKSTDSLVKIMQKRKSERVFHNYEMSEKELGSLFMGFAQKEDTTRVLPSAGGKYPVEIYAFLFHVKSKLNHKIVYYNSDTHSLSVVGDCEEWSIIQEHTGLWIEGDPSIFFVFVGLSERVCNKYQERGGRFFLMEVGHYAQNLGLRIAFEDLKGVEAGGLYDDEIKKLLKLEHTSAKIALGMACGK